MLAPLLDVSAHVVEATARRTSLGAASWTKTLDNSEGVLGALNFRLSSVP